MLLEVLEGRFNRFLLLPVQVLQQGIQGLFRSDEVLVALTEVVVDCFVGVLLLQRLQVYFALLGQFVLDLD